MPEDLGEAGGFCCPMVMITSLYFAYGSNMNATVMQEHGGFAEILGPARLEGWGLREREHADIEQAPGEWVDGLVWLIDETMARALDDYESVPCYYEDIEVRVRLSTDGREVDALCYRMSTAAARARDGVNFHPDYAWLCAAGARLHHVPLNALFAARCRDDGSSLV